LSSCIFHGFVDGIEEASFVSGEKPVIASTCTKTIINNRVPAVPSLRLPHIAGLSRKFGERVFTVARAVASCFSRLGVGYNRSDDFTAGGEPPAQEVLHSLMRAFPGVSGDGFRLRFGVCCHFASSPREKLDTAAKRSLCALPDWQ